MQENNEQTGFLKKDEDFKDFDEDIAEKKEEVLP